MIGPAGTAAATALWCAVVAASGCASTGGAGDGTAETSSATAAVTATSAAAVTFGGVLAAGNAHTCAIVSNGVRCWGANTDGELGNNSTADSFQPVPVSNLAAGVIAIAAGGAHTCAIVNGGARCWGDDASGQLGNGKAGDDVMPLPDSLVPANVTGLSHGVQAISGGDLHTCAIVNGAGRCWGANDFGQLGNGDPTNHDRHSPVAVGNLSGGFQAISAGGSHSCAVVSGAAWCWGFNGNGQLGNATPGNPVPGDSNVPVQVTGLTSGVVAIAAGSLHTCAVVSGGVQCWGDNSSGQLGTGATDLNPVRSPVPVPTLTSGVVAIAAGSKHTCALLTGGSIQCWGNNGFGQVGNDSKTAVIPTPTPIAVLTTGLDAFAVGHRHGCADQQGSVWCWGDNGNGEIGMNPDLGLKSTAPQLLGGVSAGRVPFVPLHVRLETIVLAPPDLAFSTSPAINTTNLTINGVTSPYLVRQDNYAVLFASAVSLQLGSLVTGTSPLIVVANNDVSLAGFYDLRGNGATGGPGAAAPGAAGAGGDGAGTRTPEGKRWGAGGGGGGYGTAGAAGGSNNVVTGGAGGAAHGGGIQDVLIGGSPGGGGGLLGGHGAGGGGGGGLQVSSATSVSVSGVIGAGGGGGPGGGTGDTGGGGGGAGGEIILEAPSITVSGTLAANGGGGGGGGGAGGGGSPPGTAGATGNASLTPAAGGAAGVPQGSVGGAGATGNAAAVAGQGGNSKDGGGGGGVGRIWLRYRAGSPPNLAGSLITPAAGQDPTLP